MSPVAALFAFLTPLWIFIMPDDIWPRLAAGRLVATFGFVVLALAWVTVRPTRCPGCSPDGRWGPRE